MRVVTLTAPVFGTNCYVVSASNSGPCIIVDPGGGVADAVRGHVAREGLEPVAVLATHGHVDHTWSAAELSREYDVAFWLHSADAYRVADPFGSLEHDDVRGRLTSGPLGAALAASGCAPQDYQEPQRIERFLTAGESDEVLDLGGLRFTAVHAPGHTEGSTLFVFEASAPDAAAPGFVLTGDVLFAGTIGRTDLPGGDGRAMERTLREVVGVLEDRFLVLPGHGPSSRMDHEKRTNPFLAHG